MSWIKLDTAFHGHPKVVAAGRDARDVYVAGLTWAGAYFTDGFLPATCLTRLSADAAGGDGASIDAAAAAQRLMAVGLWEKAPGGFQIHDYLRHQTSRAKMRATARKRAQAGAVGGSALGKQNGSKTEANGETNHKQTVEQTASIASSNDPANEPEESRSKEVEGGNAPPTPPSDDGGNEARANGTTGLRAVPKPRERERAELTAHPLYPALTAAVGVPVGQQARDELRQALADLDDAGATPGDVSMRAANYPKVMGTAPDGRPILLTPAALVRHWARCEYAPVIETDDEVLDERADWGRRLNENRRRVHEQDEPAQAAVVNGPALPAPDADEIEYVAPARAAPGQYAHPLALGGRRPAAGEVRHELGRRWAYEAAAPGWRRLE